MFKTEEKTKPLLKKLYHFLIEVTLKTEHNIEICRFEFKGSEFGIDPEEAFNDLKVKSKLQIFQKYPTAKLMDMFILDAKLLAE